MNQALRDAEALLLGRFSEVTLAALHQQLQHHFQERDLRRGHAEAHQDCVKHESNEQQAV